MSIQCVECANTEIYVLLVSRNILEYISLLFIFWVLRHIAFGGKNPKTQYVLDTTLHKIKHMNGVAETCRTH
jgi:hypothetical protein